MCLFDWSCQGCQCFECTGRELHSLDSQDVFLLQTMSVWYNVIKGSDGHNCFVSSACTLRSPRHCEGDGSVASDRTLCLFTFNRGQQKHVFADEVSPDMDNKGPGEGHICQSTLGEWWCNSEKYYVGTFGSVCMIKKQNSKWLYSA